MEEEKIKIHPRLLNALKTLGSVLLLIVVVFLIASIRHLAELDTTNPNTKPTTTGSIIDAFIPTTVSPNTLALEEISEIFNHAIDPAFAEIEVSYWLFNGYMKQLNYYYSPELNTKAYRYENKTIIYLNDLSGLIKIFIFNTNTYELINSIKTTIPLSDTYTNSFTVIDGEIYYINSNTYRNDNCLIINSPLVINKYDLTRELDYEFKTFEDTTSIDVLCS